MAVKVRKLLLATLPLLTLCQACGIEGPEVSDPSISDEDRAYGKEAHPQLLAEFGGDYRARQAAYVRTIGERVAKAAGLEGQCTFTLVNSDVVNAFAVPGCYIYVTRGLAAIVTSEAELASVLGHEVGHVVGRHAQKQERRSLWRTLGVIAVSLTGSERLTRLTSQAVQYFGLRYSRTQEYEADDLSVGYLERAGYDVFAAADMLGGLQRQDDFMTATHRRDQARSVPEWALSHPLTKHRIDRAFETARKTGLKDDALPESAERYLAEVDGLLFGDDPEQGFVTGRRFAHPIMQISFEAPPGFSLTNSPRAIGIHGPGGISGEFGGGDIKGGDLKEYAEALASEVVGKGSGRVTGATVTTINGLPAILTHIQLQVRDGSIPIDIAVYGGGSGRAYHFVIASPPADVNAATVDALFASFRRLSQTEIASLRPRFVRTVKASAAVTPEALIRQVADPAPRALFELLNGRGSDRPIRPGEIVKIVTYLDRK